jgi:hypothetical protein
MNAAAGSAHDRVWLITGAGRGPAVIASDDPPLRLPLGALATRAAEAAYRGRLAECEAWADLALGADSV